MREPTEAESEAASPDSDPYAALESALGRLWRVVEPVRPRRLRRNHSNAESVANSARAAVRDLIAPALRDALDASTRLAAVCAERDELWAAMQRVARNTCDCDARDGDECPVYPAEHREHCTYSLAHSAEPESTAPILWDDNYTLAQGQP